MTFREKLLRQESQYLAEQVDAKIMKIGMTAEEFEKRYCSLSRITIEQYRKWRVTLPCECDDSGCEGWASIQNDPDAIAAHKRFYSPLEIE